MPNMGENKSCVGFGGFGEKRVKSVHTPFFFRFVDYFFCLFQMTRILYNQKSFTFFFFFSLLIAVEYILQTK